MEKPLILVINPFQSKWENQIVEILKECSKCKYICINDPGPGSAILRIRPKLIYILLDQCIQQNISTLDNEAFISVLPSVPIVGIVDSRSNKLFCSKWKKFIWSFITVPFSHQDILLNVDWYLSGQENNIQQSTYIDLKQKAEYELLKGQSLALLEIKAQISRIAPYDVTVLICGETGTGKELCARMIHFLRHKTSKPFVPVNCGAVPEELLENELFGHKKGAYTHAYDTETGLVKSAQGGTLFLDEIEALSKSSQAKLLRFIEDKRFKPLGHAVYFNSDVRIIAAAKENLWDLVLNHQFREDLYYRLNVVKINLPPLRERCEDISVLARHFVRQYSLLYKKSLQGISPLAILKLNYYNWPGNVRELENIIQEAVVNSTGEWIEMEDLNLHKQQKSSQIPIESFQAAKNRSIEAFERDYLTNLLASSRGNISQAAKFARKERSAFCRLLKKHHIDADVFRK